ncbi:MAG: signal peptidase I [Clostridia bacterium]|nr:signal peptidase I [Clostridia bacterium]
MSDNLENNNSDKTKEVNIEQKTVITIEEEKPKKKSIGKEILDWIISIAVAVVAVMLINQFLFVQVMVDGQSMVPTLQDGDRLFAYRFLYEPESQDIVVVEPFLKEGTVDGKLMFGRTLYIKRVIATEGQTVDIKDDKVYVDGELFDEPYIAESVKTKPGTLSLPVTVPEDCVFVMGDNREHSRDSRDATVGILRNDQVVGKATFRLFPFNTIGIVK